MWILFRLTKRQFAIVIVVIISFAMECKKI